MDNRERIAEISKVLEEYSGFPQAAALKLVELGYTRPAEPAEDRVEAVANKLSLKYEHRAFGVLYPDEKEALLAFVESEILKSCQPAPPANEVEAMAKLLALQTLESEQLDTSEKVWRWVVANDFTGEYMTKACEVLELFQPELKVISPEERQRIRIEVTNPYWQDKTSRTYEQFQDELVDITIQVQLKSIEAQRAHDQETIRGER